jgi:hypothetical protein
MRDSGAFSTDEAIEHYARKFNMAPEKFIDLVNALPPPENPTPKTEPAAASAASCIR